MAGLNVVEFWTSQVQERGESSWHEFEKDRDDEIGNGDILRVVEVVVQAVQIDDVWVADWCVDWQL